MDTITTNSFIIDASTGYIVGGKFFYMTPIELYGVLIVIFCVSVAVAFNLFKAWKGKEIKKLENSLKILTDKNL